MAAGHQASETLTADERVAQEFTAHLVGPDHGVNPELYRRAVAALGAHGMADVVFLTGHHRTLPDDRAASSLP